ncbi:hypothetical protein TWF481_009596 [Arthrobotrys musiformis]|uniref:non-specific serine/threonine protein kinase n=1 Tax=Arthrobotrys musiformis TaxID=47236 RepID=A0AAV9W609_9PEZI
MSPPSTPPPEMPSAAKRRFHDIQRAEYVELYRPGGYHPVHFGDFFHNGRYQVIHKLGYGRYATVWLARDTQSSELVALKIKMADDSIDDREFAVLNHLNASRASGPMLGSDHVICLKDSFYHQGPNGNHRCLVFELLGDNIYSILEDYSFEMTGLGSQLTKFPKPIAKRILKDVLLGLNFLHQNGVVHGDLQPGNFISSIKPEDLDSLGPEYLDVESRKTVAEACKAEGAVVAVERLDGKLDKWAPGYLVRPQFPVIADEWPVFPIKISDLGAGILTSEPPTANMVVLAIGLRPPELMLNSHPLDTYIDIWSFGCLMFEMIVGRQLLLVMPCGNIDDANDDCLLHMDEILGPLPEEVHLKWTRSGKYFRAGSREHYNSMIDGPEGIVKLGPNMETMVRQAIPEEEEANVIISLLRKILDYDPLKRPSALEILKNSFWDEDTVA